jgi:indolepyruvate ferredoxin oxidoreductase
MDERAGLCTAGFISGYRGSPLAGLDRQFWRSRKYLEDSSIRFEPGLNEDLAVTAVWGTQQAEMRGEGRYDGVFSLWYGKGPGVDRSGDALRHANMAGSSKHGGVIALMGDDHTAESSSLPHQSEFVFIDSMMPILSPANLEELIDYGLYSFALSRFAGVWVGLKAVKDTIESTTLVSQTLETLKRPSLPQDFPMPPDGVNIRPFDTPAAQERRLFELKSQAVKAFIRVNSINRWISTGGEKPCLGIITTGKSYLDTCRALQWLGFSIKDLDKQGIRLLKIGCPWPLLEDQIRDFACNLNKILVVEEKRALIETQVYQALYGQSHAPLCVGKRDELGQALLPSIGALTPHMIAQVIAQQLLSISPSEDLQQHMTSLMEAQKRLAGLFTADPRRPHYCSGCPHNRSTVVPHGMRASAGIGCHYMVQWMDRSTDGFTHMGAEGANWIGEAPFSKRSHIIQNLGDGTYAHSGILAIRWAIATHTSITYKILFNHAVAMTGGQPLEGGLTVDQLARQLDAEGVSAIAIVSDQPGKYSSTASWPKKIAFYHRNALEQVQKELSLISGVTVLIYDQACASELRRQRKRKKAPDPPKRIMINAHVCEGCGDCGRQSNCVSLQPLDTEFGRKRVVEQSSCNKDFSCVKGFCPSFVTIYGGELKRVRSQNTFADLPEPPRTPVPDRPWNIVVAGVGGTGIITIGAILAMGAHLEGKGCATLDMTGLAQKGGSVQSHIRLAPTQDHIQTIRIDCEEADVILGCDVLVTASQTVLSMAQPGKTRIVVSTGEVAPGEFVRDSGYVMPIPKLKAGIAARVGLENISFLDARLAAIETFGESLMANMIVLGYGYQKGYIPLKSESLEQALALNGQDVSLNIQAFRFGRYLALEASQELSSEDNLSLDTVIARRVDELTQYHNARYSQRYIESVNRVRMREHAVMDSSSESLTRGVAYGLFKLMAIKDEYEVARLYTNGRFAMDLDSVFEKRPRKIRVHLAPPILSVFKDPATGRPRKWAIPGFFAWPMLRLLAQMKFIRGTAIDLFAYTKERRQEKELLAHYEKTVMEIILPGLTQGNYQDALDYVRLPDRICGFGYVKEAQRIEAQEDGKEILKRFCQNAS